MKHRRGHCRCQSYSSVLTAHPETSNNIEPPASGSLRISNLRVNWSVYHVPARWSLCSCCASQITNFCITLNEFPYIRYYVPQTHKPLGPLAPHASTRAPPPPATSARWRTNLARGSEARAWETAETDYVTKLMAHMVQQNLDDHKKLDPDFAVGHCIIYTIIPPNAIRARKHLKR